MAKVTIFKQTWLGTKVYDDFKIETEDFDNYEQAQKRFDTIKKSFIKRAKRSKGLEYVEYKDCIALQKALMYNGVKDGYKLYEEKVFLEK